MSPQTLVNSFKLYIVPFFQTISHRSVLSSAVLETRVGKIYSFIFGLGGERAEALLTAACEALSKLGTDHASSDTVSAPKDNIYTWLEATSAVLCKIIEVNSSAKIMPCFQVYHGQLSTLFHQLSEGTTKQQLAQAQRHLSKIHKILNMGNDIPDSKQKSSGLVSTVKALFTIKPERPGELPNGAPRHDNDFDDIRQMRIMPTEKEIKSEYNEYLPKLDPSTWHVDGRAGLVDRHFRLLREDTVGQLRDVAKAELDYLSRAQQANGSGMETPKEKWRHGARTFTYRNVKVEQFGFNRVRGLEFAIGFDQPAEVYGMSTPERQEWWEMSKRLGGDGLICLLDLTGSVVFCCVNISRPPVDQKSKNQKSNTLADKFSLHADRNRAYVVAHLVELTQDNVERMLATFSRDAHNGGRSLVEFPGVLLPSFFPTLTALQSIAGQIELPFSDLLAPGKDGQLPMNDGEVAITPPVYAQGEGFKWSMSSICKDSQELEIDPSVSIEDGIGALEELSTLDQSQASALVHSLSRSLALIQGPPGTGKSYTGTALVKVLLENKAAADLGPIICVCYTNHALDQMLEHLIDHGVKQVIRMGGFSKSVKLAGHNLRAVSDRIAQTKTEAVDDKSLSYKISTEARAIWEILSRIEKAGSPERVKAFLQEGTDDQIKMAEMLFGHADEEGWQEVVLGSTRDILGRWLHQLWSNGDIADRSVEDLQGRDVFTMSTTERWALYRHWISEITEDGLGPLLARLATFRELKADLDRVKQELNLRALNNADVIGVTTTGLAKNIDLLRRLDSKVLLCEEAGEVAEAHILTALLPSIEHAIFIGDHLQLRPTVQNFDLSSESKRGEPYSLDMSMFERLVSPVIEGSFKIPFSTLNTQRRMHPSISELVRQTLYPSLVDAATEYPEVVGMKQRLFWFNHQEPETEQNATMSTSRTNDFEVEMTTALISHLIKQGTYKAEDIAVLTPYLGQLRKLRQRLSRFSQIILSEGDIEEMQREGDSTTAAISGAQTTLLRALKLSTIDNFQGNEAKCVIISLVRSNEKQQVGFLKTSNRINVLLSRAMEGMYIIGNAETCQQVPMWSQVQDILDANGCMGNALELACPRHPGKSIEVQNPDDFLRLSPEGGCELPCDQRLECGHICKSLCHSELLHSTVSCLEPCVKTNPGCEHPCELLCGQKCLKKCPVQIRTEVLLDCGHVKNSLPCWQYQDKSQVECTKVVKAVVPGCQHEVTVPCHVDVEDEDYECTAICGTTRDCGHNCSRRCVDCNDREDGELVESDHGRCKEDCGQSFSTCGHACEQQCHAGRPCPLCIKPCQVQCSHSRCAKKCYEPCVPCAEVKCASTCEGSSCTLPCAAPCDWVPDSERCKNLLACGHQCPSLGGEKCPAPSSCQICATATIKATVINPDCNETYEDVDLDTDPCIFLACGHTFSISYLDSHVRLSDHYESDPNTGILTALKSPSDSLMYTDEDAARTACPKCRRSLRDIARYGRVVRRALLIETTKKLISWSNKEHVSIISRILASETFLQAYFKEAGIGKQDLIITNDRSYQFNMIDVPDKAGVQTFGRYKNICDLRRKITNFLVQVTNNEEPLLRVQRMMRDAAEKNKAYAGEPSFLQTRARIIAKAVLLRCDLIMMSDLIALRLKQTNRSRFTVDFKANRADCSALSVEAEEGKNILQAAEAHIFWARFAALELVSPISQDRGKEYQLNLRNEALSHLEAAEQMCAQFSEPTRAIIKETNYARDMLDCKSTPFPPITSDALHYVLDALEKAYTSTDHWYRCDNGHPFTVAEAGKVTVKSRCPQCGATIGGIELDATSDIAEDLM